MSEQQSEMPYIKSDAMPSKKENEKNTSPQDDKNRVELFLGFILMAVVIILSLFSNILIRVFEVVPTDIALFKATVQLVLFTLSNRVNGISVRVSNKFNIAVITVYGFLTGVAFLCFVEAVRLLPLIDLSSLIFCKPVLAMILLTAFCGRKLTKTKCFFTVSSLAGVLLLIKTPTSFSSTGSVLPSPFLDPNSGVWTGFGLAFLYNALATKSEILVQNIEVAPGVVSFWSAVGGITTAILSAFVTSEPTILSGYWPTTLDLFLLLSLSVSIIVTAAFTYHAEKLVPKDFVNTIRSLEIPLSLLASFLGNDRLPGFGGLCGVVLMTTSCLFIKVIMVEEEKKEESHRHYEAV